MERKEKRPPRITSVVFNQHGTEILTSYSSEALYLLDPKQTLTHEQSQERLAEHQKEKQARRHVQTTRPVVNESPTTPEKKTSQFKRLRLRGDWSDTGRSNNLINIFRMLLCSRTGPNSRPLNDHDNSPTAPTTTTTTNRTDEQQSNSNTSGEQQSNARNRVFQNFFMQRMSDILTQLVAGTEPSAEGQEGTNTSNPPENTNAIPPASETSTQEAASPAPATITSPNVQSPSSDDNSASAASSNTNTEETGTETNRNV